MKVRLLAPTEVEAAAELLGRAYHWSDKRALGMRLRSALAQRGARVFVAEEGGALAGMVIGNGYGPLAWIALMAVEPALQRRGVGIALMEALVAWLDESGVACTELAATAEGVGLYRRYGFVETGATEVWQCDAAGGDASAARRLTDRVALHALDREAFGGDRAAMLDLALDTPENVAFGVEGGYAIAQPWIGGVLGPVIAPDAASAARLVDAARSALPAGHKIHILPNAEWQRLLAERGYVKQRFVVDMRRGAPPPRDLKRVFARINLGQG